MARIDRTKESPSFPQRHGDDFSSAGTGGSANVPFPLPVVPFESYMIAENRDQYPMAFVVQLEFSGEFHRMPLEAAFADAIDRHPLLYAAITETPAGRMWIAGSVDRRPRVDWGPADAPIELPSGEKIDLDREAGLRIWIRQGDGTARMLLQFHHACCDGVGAMIFIGDLLAAYAQYVQPSDSPPKSLPPLEPRRLAARGYFGLTRPPWHLRLRYTLIGWREAIRLVGRSIAPLHAPHDAVVSQQGDATPFPGYLIHRFEEGDLALLRSAARHLGATLNDLLLRDLFCAMEAWNRENGCRRNRRWLRVNMPTNLRLRADKLMPAANVMSFAFVDRRARDCANPSLLLDSLAFETELIRRWRLALYFIGQLSALPRIERTLGLLLGGNRCFATAVLTNMGDPSRRFLARLPRRKGRVVAGNLVLEGITGVPPMRRNTRAAFAITTYANQLVVSLRCDPHTFSQQGAKRILRAYVAQVQRTIRRARKPTGPIVLRTVEAAATD